MGQRVERNEAEEVAKGKIAHERPCGSHKGLCAESYSQWETLGFLAGECCDDICVSKDHCATME